jgi:hypothetical protein
MVSRRIVLVHRRGSQAIEFALILPVLLLLTAGIVDYGLFFTDRLTLIAAARDGARAGGADRPGALDPCAAAVEASVTAIAASDLGRTARYAAEASDAIDGSPGEDRWIQVEITIPFAPMMLPAAAAPAALHARAVARLEDQTADVCSTLR